MLNKLANFLTDRLLSSGTIPKDEQELYIYGFFMLLSNLMYLILACFLGLLSGCILESMIFYIAFQFIRRYAGGYHASTETRCEIVSALSIAACIAAIKAAKLYDWQTALLLIALVSAVCIFCLCPLDTPEKPLSEKEFRHFRKISRLILCGLVFAIVVSYCCRFFVVFAPCCVSLILESALLLAGKLQKIRRT